MFAEIAVGVFCYCRLPPCTYDQRVSERRLAATMQGSLLEQGPLCGHRESLPFTAVFCISICRPRVPLFVKNHSGTTGLEPVCACLRVRNYLLHGLSALECFLCLCEVFWGTARSNNLLVLYIVSSYNGSSIIQSLMEYL